MRAAACSARENCPRGVPTSLLCDCVAHIAMAAAHRLPAEQLSLPIPHLLLLAMAASRAGLAGWRGMEAATTRKWKYLSIVLVTLILGTACYSLFLEKHALTPASASSQGTLFYVIPRRITLWDTPAPIRLQVANLSAGEPVYMNRRYRHWVRVRLGNGEAAWVRKAALMNSDTYEAEQLLLREIADVPVQAEGHVPNRANLHVAPSIQAPLVTELRPGAHVEMYDRRVVERGHLAGGDKAVALFDDIWYLVRAGSHVGWVLGRLVRLNIPQGLSSYAENSNIVAWFVLDTVNDQGRRIPQYLVADRDGAETADFTRIRVMTWSQERQSYVVAYVEGGLRGYFPIVVTQEGSVPYFHLRLIGAKGQRFQKTYGLFDTLTRTVSTAAGWQSPILPANSSLLASKRVKTARTSG